MRSMCAILSVLFFCSFTLAADTTSVKTTKTKPAAKTQTVTPAPAATPAPAPAAVAAPATAPATVATPAATPAPATVEKAPAAQTPVAVPAPVAEPVPAPAPAPEKVAAPELSPAPAPVVEKKTECKMKKDDKACCAKMPAQCTPPQPITWYGMAMFRLRENMYTYWPTTGGETEASNFSHQIAYKIGAIVKPNDQVQVQMELGNDWYATEEASEISGPLYTKRNPLTTPWFSLAYAQWNPGYMHIQAGIIPVKETALMDLLGMSILYNRDYKMASQLPWGVVTNYGQTGLKVGAPVLSGPFTLGIDVQTVAIQQRDTVPGPDLNTMNFNSGAYEYMLELPMTFAGINAKPQAFITPNRSYSPKSGKGDIEYGMGLDLAYKMCDRVNLRAGTGYARNSNILSGDTAGVGHIDRYGTNTNIGTTILFGTDKFDFDFYISNDVNIAVKNVNDWYPFFDFKYGCAVNKNFVIMPRVRLFFTDPKLNFNNKLVTRPELIFTGSF